MLQTMPGTIYRGDWPPLTTGQAELARALEGHVKHLAHTIGPRNFQYYEQLQKTIAYLQDQLESFGYQVRRLGYDAEGQIFENLETVSDGPCVVVGAHYDSVFDCPGANDNASGVAGVLELARILQGKPGLRFVLFANEEPPFYKTQYMGSYQYVEHIKARKDVINSMICLETIGYYTREPNSQRTAFAGLLPTVGDFVALVGDCQSTWLAQLLVSRWRAPFGCLGLAPTPEGEPSLLMAGMGMSDHACFWDAGIPALMVTDTVFYRYDHYHLPSDTWEKLTYEPFARMIEGLAAVLTPPESSPAPAETSSHHSPRR